MTDVNGAATNPDIEELKKASKADAFDSLVAKLKDQGFDVSDSTNKDVVEILSSLLCEGPQASLLKYTTAIVKMKADVEAQFKIMNDQCTQLLAQMQAQQAAYSPFMQLGNELGHHAYSDVRPNTVSHTTLSYQAQNMIKFIYLYAKKLEKQENWLGV